jgi:PadR family transcriptional regulator
VIIQATFPSLASSIYSVDRKILPMSALLARLDVLALLALSRLGEGAYGVTVREDIASVTGRDVSMAAVYAALDRLERRGLVEAWHSEPRPERGGRARRHFAPTPAGLAALRAERDLLARMWRGVTVPGKEPRP